jgi:hypothetical protein
VNALHESQVYELTEASRYLAAWKSWGRAMGSIAAECLFCVAFCYCATICSGIHCREGGAT